MTKKSKTFMYSIENSSQYSVMTYAGKESKKGCYVYMQSWFTLHYTWNQHSIVNQLYSNNNFFLKNATFLIPCKSLHSLSWPHSFLSIQKHFPEFYAYHFHLCIYTFI